MPATPVTYPDWVQAYRSRGTTIKKKGDAYYLYKRTSKRVPGKKYPQPVDTYIGIITPDGVVRTNKKKVTVTDIEVWEYGFSKAVWDLCPDSWKKPLGGDWEDVLRIILLKWSPTSYLGREPIWAGNRLERRNGISFTRSSKGPVRFWRRRVFIRRLTGKRSVRQGAYAPECR